MNLGFIGLGQMGKYCAINLLKKHGQLTVNDLNQEAVNELVYLGAKKAQRLRDLANFCDVIFLCLPNADVVEEVITGKEGLLTSEKKGQVIVDLSTVDFKRTQSIAKTVEINHREFIDSPISGRESRAKSGELSIMCGGKEETFRKILPYLSAMGTSVVYLGGYGMGQLAKTVNNVLYNINIAGLAEMLPFAIKMGLEPEKVAQVVNTGTGRSAASEYFLPKILEGDFSYGFTMNAAYKDMQSAMIASAKEKIPTPVMYAAMLTYQLTLLEGYGEDYKGAMIKVYERLLDVKFRKNDI